MDNQGNIMRYKPFLRWWWFGSAVTCEELLWELEEMKKAGIGGIEIQPVYPMNCDDPDKRIYNIPYLSGEWLKMLNFCIQAAKKLEMVIDVTCGSGWPFGGACIPKSLSAGRLRLYSEKAWGPLTYFKNLSCILDPEEKLIAVFAMPE
ncbi:MAG: hypothetical protein GX493_03720, partial [Firmicutes bacterium]|nr:hypothetical protein [Bacillota bacterium]